MKFEFNPEDYDDTCELCGRPGELISAVLLGPGGQRIQVLIHALCDQTPLGRELHKRSRARWN